MIFYHSLLKKARTFGTIAKKSESCRPAKSDGWETDPAGRDSLYIAKGDLSEAHMAPQAEGDIRIGSRGAFHIHGGEGGFGGGLDPAVSGNQKGQLAEGAVQRQNRAVCNGFAAPQIHRQLSEADLRASAGHPGHLDQTAVFPKGGFAGKLLAMIDKGDSRDLAAALHMEAAFLRLAQGVYQQAQTEQQQDIPPPPLPSDWENAW